MFLLARKGMCVRGGKNNTTLYIDEIFMTQNVGKQKAKSER